MKKTYIKPEVYFEDFELSANIASGCATPTNHAMDECGSLVPGIGVMFLDSVQQCVYKGQDGDQSICYQVPTDATRLFTS